MNRNSTLKLKKNLDVTDLAGEKVMIDFDSGKYFLIRGAGNDIWDILQSAGDGVTVEEIIDNLMSVYDVAREECESSVNEFLERMRSLGFID